MAGKGWVGARLTVVITLALVSGEEPQPIANDWTPNVLEKSRYVSRS